ncbi:preprotein translocase subunit SecY [Buchnera aphidicola]|uniref:preprotein translocase subunit SecY n=1 Tax=Buchnera aphidicola TaxID=9 RepID=UPI0031B85EB6
MFKCLGLNLSKNSFYELKNRLFFLLISVIVFRLGCFIPIPGINTSVLSQIFVKKHGTIIDMFNIFSGGSLSRASIFTLGVMPYISASIIIQLLTLVVPFLKEIKKNGESGNLKINEYIRYTTVFFAFFQAIGISFGLPNILGIYHLVINPNIFFYLISIITLVTGTVFLMWLGELITEKGIGNGISIFIFIGIISEIPYHFLNIIFQIKQGNFSFYLFLMLFFLLFFLLYVIVFIECSQRKIKVFYSRRQYTQRSYKEKNSYLPLKINISGVIPSIFSSSIIIFPTTICSWLNADNFLVYYYNIIKNFFLYFHINTLIYIIIYSCLIIFFCFFYSLLIFNPKEVSKNLKKSGVFIFGIRPGFKTENYIKKIMFRVTFIGSFYIILICLIPDIIKDFFYIPFYFGGTSFLIVTVVIIDFISQIQTLMLSSQYKNVLKKSNLNFNKKYY